MAANEIEIHLDKLDQLCRTCLSQSTQLFSVFDEQIQKGHTLHYALGFLRDFCKIPVDREDKFPRKVCQKCAEEIKRSYAFKIRCERSAEVLKRFALFKGPPYVNNTKDPVEGASQSSSEAIQLQQTVGNKAQLTSQQPANSSIRVVDFSILSGTNSSFNSTQSSNLPKEQSIEIDQLTPSLQRKLLSAIENDTATTQPETSRTEISVGNKTQSICQQPANSAIRVVDFSILSGSNSSFNAIQSPNLPKEQSIEGDQLLSPSLHRKLLAAIADDTTFEQPETNQTEKANCNQTIAVSNLAPSSSNSPLDFPKVVAVGSLIPITLTPVAIPITQFPPLPKITEVREAVTTDPTVSNVQSTDLQTNTVVDIATPDQSESPVPIKKIRRKITAKRSPLQTPIEFTAQGNKRLKSSAIISADNETNTTQRSPDRSRSRSESPITVFVIEEDESAEVRKEKATTISEQPVNQTKDTDADNDVEMVEILESGDKDIDDDEPNEESFVCHQCESVIFGEGNFIAHIAKHAGNKTVTTGKESQTNSADTDPATKPSSILDDLKRGNKADNSFLCHLCNTLIDGIDSFVSHVNTHVDKQNPKPKEMYITVEYKCNQCSVSFKGKDELSQHVKDRHAISYECATCKKHFESQDILSQHKCETEPTEIIDLDNENDPVDVEAKSDANEQSPNSFICHICKEVVDGTECFEDHIRSHTEPEEMKIVAMKTDCGFVCGECGTICKDKSILVSHVRSKHMLHSCSVCKKDFRLATELAKHKELYMNSKHGCTACRKHFRTEIALKFHMSNFHSSLTHEGDLDLDALQCKDCKQKFLNEVKYRMHLVACRSINSSFNCGLCVQSFKTEIQLNEHMVTHDMDE